MKLNPNNGARPYAADASLVAPNVRPEKMKLKCIAFLSPVLLLGACSLHREAEQTQTRLSARILVERPEDNGVLNIRMVDVILDDQQILSLSGGQAASAHTEPGKHFIRAESPDPYDPNSTNRWRAKSIYFAIRTGETKSFLVSGTATGSTYTHWELREAK